MQVVAEKKGMLSVCGKKKERKNLVVGRSTRNRASSASKGREGRRSKTGFIASSCFVLHPPASTLILPAFNISGPSHHTKTIPGPFWGGGGLFVFGVNPVRQWARCVQQAVQYSGMPSIGALVFHDAPNKKFLARQWWKPRTCRWRWSPDQMKGRGRNVTASCRRDRGPCCPKFQTRMLVIGIKKERTKSTQKYRDLCYHYKKKKYKLRVTLGLSTQVR